ncbi:MAG: hypothetical protein R3A12_13850 [Ignavibacteria bacterium]
MTWKILRRHSREFHWKAAKLVASDGVFSTTGEIVHLPKLVELCKI